jgi:acyl-coenzyme A synthetase/AMP-(fatty) acid ligase
MNLAAVLLERGRDDATALVADGVPMTYAELRRAVGKAAGAWRTLGVNPGERVVVALAPLPRYQRPVRCVAFDALPRTVTGKLLRRELVARMRKGLPS